MNDNYLSTDFFLWAGLAAVIGGIFSYILGMIFGPIQTVMFGPAIAAFLVFFLLVYLAKYSDLDGVKIFQLIVILVLIGAIGTVITSIIPAAAPFILTAAGNWTALGLGFTVIYIMIADIVQQKIL